METVYDWATMVVFGGLVVLFLQRSVQHDERDAIWQYLPPAVGCAAANYVGNQGYGPASALILVGVLAYIAVVLKPFRGLKF